MAPLQAIHQPHDLHHAWQEHKNCTVLFGDVDVPDEVIQELKVDGILIHTPDVRVHKLRVACKGLCVVELVENVVLDLLIISPPLP